MLILILLCPGRRCQHQYCWLCFADYKGIMKEGNSRHRENCRYYARNPESMERSGPDTDDGDDDLRIADFEVDEGTDHGLFGTPPADTLPLLAQWEN